MKRMNETHLTELATFKAAFCAFVKPKLQAYVVAEVFLLLLLVFSRASS